MLGVLTSVSQRTGVSVDDLSASLQNNGTVFRDMGLSAADSATLLGNFEAAGIDDATALQGMKRRLQSSRSQALTSTPESATLSRRFPTAK